MYGVWFHLTVGVIYDDGFANLAQKLLLINKQNTARYQIPNIIEVVDNVPLAISGNLSEKI